jgi:hypothetical protein
LKQSTSRHRRNQQAELVVHGVSPLPRLSGTGILLRVMEQALSDNDDRNIVPES